MTQPWPAFVAALVRRSAGAALYAAGCYDAINDANVRGEALTADDVEVELALMHAYLKRGQVDPDP